MRLYQLLLALTLGAGVSYFAGSALPETAGGVGGHALTFIAGSALFAGLFIGYNRSNRSGCGCPGARSADPNKSAFPGSKKKTDKNDPTERLCNRPNCGGGRCQSPKCGQNGSDELVPPIDESKPVPPAKKKDQPALKPDAKVLISPRHFPTHFRNDGEDGAFVEVQAGAQEDGSFKITVTANGYTSRHFKERLRPRIERVTSVKWQHPKNLGENRRQMEGTVPAGANMVEILSSLESIR